MSRFVLTAQLQLQAPNNVAQVVRQIQSQLNNVNVNVSVQGAVQAQRQLQQVTVQTQAATNAADRMGRAFAISVRRFAAFSIATRAVGLLTSTMADAVRTAIDFERQLIKVSQVTGDSLEKLKSLTRTITEFSTSLGVPSQSLLEVSTLLLQAGISAKDTEVALRTLAKAALAPNFDSITETAEGAIAILAQFGKGVGELEGQLGSINAVAGAFAVEAGDLIDVIRRTGGVFKASGGSLNELLALFTSVRATTRESAESIGTGLRTIFTRIQRPKTIEFLKQFGVELVDLEGKFVGPFEAVKRLSEALSGLGEGDITFIRIAEELGGFRQIGKVLPLLQQFSLAQQALNTANSAGNSLTKDAATAQAALAVRIIKVREEFLALIRGMTETQTFQIMANTALTFASALIKIGEAIKPLLPLLGALAAINLAKGLGSFAGGFMRGASSGRTYSTGGKVEHFARGGLVPGRGNRDTVPAMLTPGEFVIRKSSVQKLGAGNLAAMNENRYAGGGTVNPNRNAYGDFPLNQLERRTLSRLMNPPRGTRLSAEDRKLRDELSRRKQASSQESPDFKTAYLKDGAVGGLFLQKGSGGTKGITKILQGEEIPGYPNVKQVQGNVYTGLLKSEAASSLRAQIEPAVVQAVENASKATMQALEIPPLNIDEKAAAKNAVNRVDIGSIEGHIFEAFISAMSGAKLSDAGASFDFINPSSESKKRLQNIFGPSPVSGKLLDAKRTLGTDTMLSAPNSIANKIVASMKSGLLSPSDFIMKNLGGLIKKFATGGGVGTDTVPALLTPGEFVINRSSAQKIGYSNLHRMNKVGKYATGGVVQRFRNGGMPDASSRYSAGFIGSGGLDASQNLIPFDMLSRQAQSLADAQQRLQGSTQSVDRAQQQQTRSISEFVAQNKIGLVTTTAALLQGFLPAIDENSGVMLKLTQSLLGLVTTVAATTLALQAFGIQLNAQSISRLATGGGMSMRGLATMRSGLMSAGLSKGFATAITGATQGLLKFAGPVGAAIGVITGVNTVFTALFSNVQALNKAIEAGDVEKAGKLAGGEAQLSNANTGRLAGGGIGAIIGTIFGGPGVGTAIGTVIGTTVGTAIGNLFSTSAASKYAQAQAQAVKTQQTLDNAQKEATTLLQDFNNGTISAADALSRLKYASDEVENSRQRTLDAIGANTNRKNQNTIGGYIGGSLRNLGALGGLNPFMETSGARSSRLDKDNAELNKKLIDSLKASFELSRELRNETIRSAAFRGVTPELGNQSVEALRAKAEESAQAAVKTKDEGTRKILLDQARTFAEQAAEVERSLANIGKEVELAKAKFAALNLGFRNIVSASDAAALKMNNLMAGFEVGGNPAEQAAATLEAALTSAGQNISKVDFESALSQVNDVFTKFGASGEQIDKFNNLISGVAGVQREFPQIFEQLKKDLLSGDLKDIGNPEAIGQRFRDIVASQLEAAGIGKAARDQIIAAMGDVKITPEDVSKISSGDFSVLEKYLGDAAKEVQETMRKVIDNYTKVNQQLIKVTQERIEAERNFVEAQKEAIDLLMEGREVQAKYGGQKVSQEERRMAVLAKANANRAGVPNLRTGSVAELRARNADIAGRFFNIEGRRRVEGGMSRQRGVEMDATQKDLQKAQKDQVQTIRDLIKIEEESLKIIQEKNKLEKDSMDSLISGDIEKFFEQQAAVGAQAALAAGNTDLANMFGAEAVGAAFQDIMRQMEAGVQDLFGRQLGGPGGLAEQAARAAAASRGVTDPRVAQTMAGTTPEEMAIKNILQGLGQALTEAGAWQMATAEMELNTAQMRVEKAELIVANLETGGNAAEGKAKGGLIYANRGIFVPRGTDTVPAMLTPGEFVVRREAVNRGNNLQLLRAINNGGNSGGFARGGKVGYYANGGVVQYKALGDIVKNLGSAIGIKPEIITNLGNVFTTFTSSFNESIKALQSTKLHLTLDSVNVNVNFTGGSALNNVTAEAKRKIMDEVISEIRKEYGVSNNGQIAPRSGNLPQPGPGM